MIKSKISLFLLSSFLAILSTSSVLSLSTDAFSQSHNTSLIWGPYRPNLYFGIRPRIPEAISTSLIWARVDQYDLTQARARHTCEQGAMATYGWTHYDPRSGGVQVIQDPENGIDIEIQWVKSGDNWGARIKGSPREGQDDVKTTLVWSLAVEGALGTASVETKGNSMGIEGDVVLRGNTIAMGDFSMVITEGKGKRPIVRHTSGEERSLDRTFVVTTHELPENLWHSKGLLFKQLSESYNYWTGKYGKENPPPPWQFYTMEPNPGTANHHLIQKTFEGAFEFDVLYGSGLTSEQMTGELKSAIRNFDHKFDRVLQPLGPFNDKKHGALSKSLFSNLLGGIGFFHGKHMVDRSNALAYEEDGEGFWEDAAEARSRAIPSLEGPFSLFTSIPSRPFFPRGFLWDEGFHLIPVMDWDIDLAMDIVQSWFSLVDEDGWIPREIILGPEARSKVPAEFQTQYPQYANPPTIFLILADFVSRLGTSQKPDSQSQLLDKEKATSYLNEIYPKVKKNYEWFRCTQQADYKTYDRKSSFKREAYRWRGRTQTHCLTSGLDDYPRAQPPHPGEMHVDALSWVGLMAKSLRRIADFLGKKDDAAIFAKHEHGITTNLLSGIYWSEKHSIWCDVTIDEFEEETPECRVGYVSLLPWIVGLIEPKNAQVGKILDVLADKNGLWSDFGIRSLSKQDKDYGTGENYWKGPIWMNINYLIVDRLRDGAERKGPYQVTARKLYTELRKNLVNTVSKSWDETGFAWEQYNPETGAGQRTQHFTGWTSLAVKLMAMPESIETDAAKDEL